MERVKNFWIAFKDIALIFSFAVNFVLVIVLLVVSIPALRAVFTLKTTRNSYIASTYILKAILG